MKKKNTYFLNLAFVLLGILYIILSPSTLLAKIIYINGTTGDNDNGGLSWGSAKQTVQAGLNVAVSNDQVWVAAGTYVEQVTIKSGVSLYGGFNGNEVSLGERNWSTNITILDGNQNGSVVSIPSGATADTRIDGFTIRNGTGTLIDGKRYGGGIYCGFGSAAIIAHNTITENTSDIGGAIYTYGNTANTIIADPPSLNLMVGNTGTITFSIPEPAPDGGLNIILSSSSPIVATVLPFALIPEGQLSIDVTVTAVGYGNTTIAANATNLGTARVPVEVINPPLINFSPSPINVAVGLIEKCTIIASNPAPAGGLLINITGGEGKIEAPASVTIPESGTATIFYIKGLIQGSTTVVATASGYPSANLQVNITPAQFNLFPSYLSIAVGRSSSLTLSIPNIAPAGGLTANMSSSNSAFVTVPTSVTIPEGEQSAIVPINGIGVGTATVTASLTGFQDAQATINVLSEYNISFLPSSLQMPPGVTKSTDVVISSFAPEGGLTISLSNPSPEKVNVPGSVFIPEGKFASTINVLGLAESAGEITIIASCQGLTDGYLKVIVQPVLPMWLLADVTVGAGTQTRGMIGLTSGTAPTGGYTVNLISSDQTIASVPATVTIPQGQRYTDFTIMGHSVGTAVIQLSVSGFTEVDTVTVVKPTFQWNNVPSQVTIGATSAVSSYTYVPNGSYYYINYDVNGHPYVAKGTRTDQVVNQAVVVSLSSENPSVIQTPATATISVGNSYAYFNIQAVGTGSSTLTASASGWDSKTSSVIQVVGAWLLADVTVGAGTQTTGAVGLTSGTAPTGGYTVNLISSDQTIASVPATVTIAEGNSYTYFTIVGHNVGTAVIQLSVSGFTEVDTVTVVKPTFQWNNVPSQVTIGATSAVSSYTYVPNGSYYQYYYYNNPPWYKGTRTDQVVNQAVVVSLSSENPSVIQVPATATISVGNNYAYFNIQAVGTGSSTLTASASGWDSKTSGVIQVTSGTGLFYKDNSFFAKNSIPSKPNIVNKNNIAENNQKFEILSSGQGIIQNLLALSIISFAGEETDKIIKGSYGTEAFSPTVEYNIINGNTAQNGGGIACFISSAIIRNNLFVGNSSAGDLGGGAIYISGQSSDVLITGNTICQNSANSSNGGGIFVEEGLAAIKNCILWENGDDLWNCSAIYSLVTDISTDPGNGNLSENPIFIQTNNPGVEGYYHLGTGSPCINAGDPAYTPAFGEADIDGDARVVNQRIDIGADEVADETVPVISNINLNPSENQCVVTWKTDEVATSQVEYGETEAYGSITPLQTQLVTEHNVTITGLISNTTYHCRIHSQDAFGNTAISPDMSFVTIADTNMPETIITTAPSEGGTACSIPVQICWTGSDNETQVGQLLYSFRIDGGAWSEWSTSICNSLTLTDGQHVFEVKAKDLTDNEDQTPATRSFSVDTGVPLISSITSDPEAGSVDITWNTNEPCTSQVEYGLDSNYGFESSLQTSLVTSHTVTIAGLEPNTTYHFQVKSKDACEREAESDDLMFTTLEDTSAPETHFTSGPDNNGKACDTAVDFCWIGDDDATPDSELQYSFKIDEQDWSEWSTDTCNSFIGLPEGLHTIQVKSKDDLGNVDSTPAYRNFYVDKTPPTLSNVSVSPKDYRATINWNTSEPATSQVEYGMTTAYGISSSLNNVMDGAHMVILWGLSPETTYHFRVKSNDGCHEVVSGDQTFTTMAILPPNLSIRALQAPQTTIALGKIEVSWLVENKGPGDATTNWVDNLYLSPDDVLDENDTPLGTFQHDGALPEFGVYSRTVQLQMPLLQEGSYYLFVKSDAMQAVVETNEEDNLQAQPIDFLHVETMVVSPGEIPLNLVPGVAVNGQLDIGNLGATAMTGIEALIENATPNIEIQITTPQILASKSVDKVNYTVIARDESVLQNSPIISFTNDDIEETSVTFNIKVIPRHPNLSVNPGYLETGMLRGMQTLVECELSNIGAVPVYNLVVQLPATTWMSLITPENLGTLMPGEKKKIGISLLPPSNLQLGPYSGNIVVSGSNANLSIGFLFNAISDGIGDLKIHAEDEFTYFADEHPPVTGAKVVLKNATTGTVVYQGETDDNGVCELQQVVEGFYNLEVAAEKHGTYRSTVEVIASKVNEILAFLPRQLVTYTWNVVPVETEDKYEVKLEAVFETHVPAPVITVDPMVIDLTKLSYDSEGKTVVNYTITNHGLIAANDVAIKFNTHALYQLTPLIENLGQLKALSSIIVPVTITRLNVQHSTSKLTNNSGGVEVLEGSIVDCIVAGIVDYFFWCDIIQHRNTPIIAKANELCLGSSVASNISELGTGNGYGSGSGPSINAPSFSQDIDCSKCLNSINGAFLGCAQDFVGKIVPLGCVAGPIIDTATLLDQCASNGYQLDCAKSGLESIVSIIYDCILENPIFGSMWTAYTCYQDLIHACPELQVTNIKDDRQTENSSNNIPLIGYKKSFGTTPVSDEDIKIHLENLKTQMDRVKLITEAFTQLFGDPTWLSCRLDEENIFRNWLTYFVDATDAYSEIGIKISESELSQLKNYPLPSQLTIADVENFVTRWNRTQNYWESGIFEATDVPPGENTDFIAVDLLNQEFNNASNAAELNIQAGYQGVFDGIGAALQQIKQDIFNAPESGVCAQVRIRVDQQVTLTRTSFQATLEIENSPDNVQLQNVSITLNILDDNGTISNDNFGISVPELTNITDITGDGSIIPGAKAKAIWTLTPMRDAALDQPKQYFVGGTLEYDQGDMHIIIPLFPATILVKPDPLLALDYFLIRDVYSDDPFTPQIELAEPFPLGLILKNLGKGEARNVRITSSQPQIVENELGLLINFNIIGTQVNTDQVEPSLTVNLGNVGSGQTGVAMWLMTSTLEGRFIEYKATFEHVDELGDPRLSLIDSVNIHELIHAVRIDIPSDDYKPDFLVNDNSDPDHFPDTLYNSDGSTAVVNVGLNPVVAGQVTNDHLEVQLSATVPTGWVYIQADDPGQEQFPLERVVRSDGREILINENAWTTHRTIRLEGQPPYRQNLLHLLDKDSTGSYTLVYGVSDKDNDGIPNNLDICPDHYNPDQFDNDNDKVGNVCDNCWQIANPNQLDSNGNCSSPPYDFDPTCGDACDLCTDLDGDGYGREGLNNTGCAHSEYDCDDTNPAIYPGAPEVCNGKDDDCDTLTDEDLSQSCGTGACAGTKTCSTGSWTNCNSYNNVCGDCALCSAEGECNVFSSGTLCRPSVGVCDVAEYCTGSAPECPPDASQADGTACSDGTACTTGETCSGGICAGGVPVNCDDSNICTNDSCEPSLGCQNIQVIDGTSCSNLLFCDGEENCKTGECSASTPPNVDDEIACTKDSCDEEENKILHLPDDSLCNDDEFCNGIEVCNAEVGCQPGISPELDDNNECTEDSCDEINDVVMHDPRPQVGNLCINSTGICLGNGTCFVECMVDGDCNDNVACTLNQCDTSQTPYKCVYIPDNTFCSDGEYCNGIETCDAVLGCQSDAPPQVDDENECTDDSCDEENDRVVHDPQAHVDQLCKNNAGICQNDGSCDVRCMENVECTDGIDCTIDWCNTTPSPYVCVHDIDDSLCNDDLFCNGVEVCNAELGCQSGTSPQVNDANECTEDYCDEVKDEVVHDPLPHAGDLCINNTGTCQADGSCRVECVEDGDCADPVPCTIDRCNTIQMPSRCVHEPDITICNDYNGCTLDICDLVAGCQHPPVANNTPCDDGNPSTGNDVCVDGMCIGTTINRNPVITSTPVTEATAGVLYSYDVEARDDDGDTLTYILTIKPTGMTINGSTGLIQWTPTSSQVGTRNVTVEVSDGRGGRATQSFTITVKRVDRTPPVISLEAIPFFVKKGKIVTIKLRSNEALGKVVVKVRQSLTKAYPVTMQLDTSTTDPYDYIGTFNTAQASLGLALVQADVQDLSGNRSLAFNLFFILPK